MMDSDTKTNNLTRTMRLPKLKVLLMGIVLLGLSGVVIFATLRERDISPIRDTGTDSRFELMRPPLTAEEERYASALWPIHSEVKLNAVNMSFAGISYKLGEIHLKDLGSRLKLIAENFEKAVVQFQQLQPPASMEKAHQNYAEALKLYQESVTEMAKIVDDSRDEHLLVAQIQSEKASTILIKLSDELWPGEYKPN